MSINAEYIEEEVSRGQQYFLVLLQRGPRERNNAEVLKDFQQRHLQHIFKLRRLGKLVLNGPTLVDSDLRGICIYNLSTAEEVQRCVKSDPMVEAGFLIPEVYPWLGLPGDLLPLRPNHLAHARK